MARRRLLCIGPGRPAAVALWQKTTTLEDPEWTRCYHSLGVNEKAFGARVVITSTDGSTVTGKIAVADARPLGAWPFGREQYIGKFRTLARRSA